MSYAQYARRTAKRIQYRSINAPAIITTYPKYEPASQKAEDFHNSDKDIRAIFGGDRAGKSGTGGYETIDDMRRHPGTLHWCVCLKQSKIRSMYEWHKKWLDPSEYTIVGWYNKGKGIPSHLRHNNGSMLEYLTAASGADTFSADKVQSIHIDEDPERETPQGEQVYNDCLSRIIQGGRLWITATPVLGKNWMYNRIDLYNKNEREDKSEDTDIERWHVSLLENRFIDEDQKIKAKGRMSADEIDRRFYGLFTSLQGAVFKNWNEDLSVVDFGKLPAGIEKIVALDLGMVHPTVALYMGQFNEKIYVWQEYYQKGLYLYQHAENILSIEKDMSYFKNLPDWRPYRPRVSDHDAQDRFELERYGVRTIPAIKNVEEGVQIMGRLMMPDENGVPNLLIHPRCYELRRTIPLLHYKPIRAGADEKEVIAKVDDDPPDACRYGVMYFKSRPPVSLHGMSATADEID
jgi:hypothetical protein